MGTEMMPKPSVYGEGYYGFGPDPNTTSNYKIPYDSPSLRRNIRFFLSALPVYFEFSTHFPNKKEVEILDLGGATGRFADQLQRIPIDIQRLLNSNFVKKMLPNQTQNIPNVRTFLADYGDGVWKHLVNSMKLKSVQADARHIPFEACSFDGLTCFDVLEHIPEGDIPGVAGEIFRILRPGGRAIILPNIGSANFYGDKTHITLRGRQWWTDIFKQAGFKEARLLLPYELPFLGNIYNLKDKIPVMNPGFIILDKAQSCV